MYFFSNSPVKWRLTKVVCDKAPLVVVLRPNSLLLPPKRIGGCTHLASTAITDEHELEGGLALLFRHLLCFVEGVCWCCRNTSVVSFLLDDRAPYLLRVILALADRKSEWIGFAGRWCSCLQKGCLCR